jgi:hypothetical protein
MGNTTSVAQTTADSLTKSFVNDVENQATSQTTTSNHQPVSIIQNIFEHQFYNCHFSSQTPSHNGSHGYHHYHHKHAAVPAGRETVYPVECPMHAKSAQTNNNVTSSQEPIKVIFIFHIA